MPFDTVFNYLVKIGFTAYEARVASKQSKAVAASAREMAERIPMGGVAATEVLDYIETDDSPPQEPFKEGTAGISPGALPTTEETILHCKRRLATELYRFELDLVDKCKIMGKACDCCEKHPAIGFHAMAGELIPMEPRNTVYAEIMAWVDGNARRLTMEASASGQFDEEYPVMASQVREFRKRVMGTESVETLLSKQEKDWGERRKKKPVTKPLPQGRSPATVPIPREESPMKPDKSKALEPPLEFLADSIEQVDQTVNGTGYRPKLDAVFQEAISRVNSH